MLLLASFLIVLGFHLVRKSGSTVFAPCSLLRKKERRNRKLGPPLPFPLPARETKRRGRKTWRQRRRILDSKFFFLSSHCSPPPPPPFLLQMSRVGWEEEPSPLFLFLSKGGEKKRKKKHTPPFELMNNAFRF